MKALFIGGTGTVSTACAKLCIEQGMDLSLLLRGTRDHRVAPKAKVIHGDIRRDPVGVRRLLDSQTWDCVVDWVTFEERDVTQDVEFFRGRTKKFVFISSTCVYEKPLPSARVNELTPIGNRYWAYADRKARCERLLRAEYERSGFPVVIVRPGHMYAEFTLPTGFAGMGFAVVKRILDGKPIVVHGDGTGLWTLTFSEDFARAFVPLLALDSAVGETFQITSDELLSWIRIYDLIGEAFGCPVKYVCASSCLISRFDTELGATLLGDKAHTYLFDNSKIKRYVPSFSARVPFRVGVGYCAAWYREHKETLAPHAEKERLDRLMDAIVSHVERPEPRRA